jgi:YesN/AraC family two-component response regulator
MESMTNPRQSFSVLLVEDDKTTLDLLAIILTKKYPNAALYTAINARTGLELFTTHMPDIVITDINMPGMSGVQMAAKIWAIKPGSKLIVISGNTGKLPLVNSNGEGFEIEHYIEKPVNFGKLFAAIEQCFGEISKL